VRGRGKVRFGGGRSGEKVQTAAFWARANDHHREVAETSKEKEGKGFPYRREQHVVGKKEEVIRE